VVRRWTILSSYQTGKKVAVSEEVYRAYKRPQWREEYHAEKEKERHIPYDKLIESDYQLKEHRFTLSASAEELAIECYLSVKDTIR
jgi:hypothetical protein